MFPTFFPLYCLHKYLQGRKTIGNVYLESIQSNYLIQMSMPKTSPKILFIFLFFTRAVFKFSATDVYLIYICTYLLCPFSLLSSIFSKLESNDISRGETLDLASQIIGKRDLQCFKMLFDK